VRTVVPRGAKLIPEEAERVFEGKIFDVYQWQQEMFDGSFATFEMVKRLDTVNVFAVRDGKLVILKQEQPGSGEFYSVPGGRHDNADETELLAAKRECLEETGMKFREWKLINVVQPFVKMEWFIYTFLATGFEGEVMQKLDSGEKIKIELMSLDEVKGLVGRLNANSRLDFPREIFDDVESIEDLENWPEYRG